MAAGASLTDRNALFHDDMVGSLCWMTSGSNAGEGREIAGVSNYGVYPTLQVADGTFTTQFSDPGLTHTIPISNVSELQLIGTGGGYPVGGNYYLTGDIDASATSGWNGGEGFIPLTYGHPDYHDNDKPNFYGTLDGCGYTISNLTIDRPSEINVALFASMGWGAKIANLTLQDCYVRGGANVSILTSEVDVSAATGESAPPTWQTGLVAAGCLIQNVHLVGCTLISSDTTVAGFPIAGAMAALVNGGWVYANGDEDDPDNWILHYFKDCSVTDFTYADDANNVDGLYEIGGFVGDVSTMTQFYNCRVQGTMTITAGIGGASIAGGFAGYIDSDTFSGAGNTRCVDCSADVTIYTDVDADTYYGGFVGDSFGVWFIRCSARGNVTGAYRYGNIAGFGEVGSVQGGALDCYAWGNVASTGTGASLAGFSYGLYGDVRNCYSVGTLTGGAGTDKGGFATFTSGIVADTYANLFWDTEHSLQATDGYLGVATGHDTKWMTTQSNYENAGWDFTDVWEMNPDSPAVISHTELKGLPITLTFVEPFPYEIELGDTYCISGVPFKARCWKLQASDVDRFNRWNMVGTMLKCRKLSGFDGNVNNKWRVSVHRGAKADLENISSYVLVDSNPSDSAGAINVDGVDLEPYIEQISAGTKFELTDAEFNVSWTDSRKVGI